jgi:hypothetical protein
VSLIAAGAATLASGVVWALLNQPRAVTEAPRVTPTVGPGGAGVTLTFSF